MSFWSRSKKKDQPSSSSTPSTTPPTQDALSPPQPLSQVSSPATSSPSIPTVRPLTSPPDSPSTISGTTVSGASGVGRTPSNSRGDGGAATGGIFPWSMRKFRNANPFPRFGHSSNVSAGKEGEVYVFGGLVKEKRRNDLYVIDSGSMTAYTISATGDGPSPRLGHASILVGNAFIVFGGECASSDLSHDDSLYLLNTSTRQWTRAVTVGPRPAPRYGHTLNILGSRLLVFGGQVDGYYFNDLVTFDLNTLSSPNARWELVQAVTEPPSARTGHVCLSLGDKLVIFGGTDGLSWFNDTWFFDARSNSWVEIECTGHIPSPREGHSAALVGEVMYIFGGRGVDGKMLGDLYAFKVSSRRWFSFHNMGAGPSPRCGHTLTSARDKVVVLGGESSAAVAGKDESTVAFVLDTSRIRFPSSESSGSTKSSSKERVRNITSPPPQGFGDRRPSSRGNQQGGMGSLNEKSSRGIDSPVPPPGAEYSEEGSINRRGPPTNRIRSPSPLNNGTVGNPPPSRGSSKHNPQGSNENRSTSQQGSLRTRTISPLPVRPTTTSPPPPTIESQPPPIESQRPPKPAEETHSREISVETGSAEKISKLNDDGESLNTGDQSPSEPKHSETHHEEGSTPITPSSPTVDDLKKQLAWATTELAVAQSKGYIPDRSSTPSADDDLTAILKTDIPPKDTKLLQALLSTRHQLSRIKELVNDQTKTASEKIAEAERQRDDAMSEIAYLRARLAAAQTGDNGTIPEDRATELSKKLVSALAIQSDLNLKVEDLRKQLELEKMARQSAEETASSHLEKFSEAEERRKEGWNQVETLKGKISETQRMASEEKMKSVDHQAQANNLRIEAEELRKQVAELTEMVDVHSNAVKATKSAISSSVERSEMAEASLKIERAKRNELEKEVLQLRQELGSLDSHKAIIEDLERQLGQARDEAESARSVMLEGLDNLLTKTARPIPQDYEGRIQTLQEHLDATKSLHSESREAADQASAELAKANERIVSLEAAQSKSVQDLSTLQSRLSETLYQLHNLQDEHTQVRSRMTDVQRELEASQVKHTALKQLLSERPSSGSPSRMVDTPDISNKLLNLEAQLDEAHRLRDEMEASHDQYLHDLSVATKRHKEATRRQREAEDRVKELEGELERSSNMSGSGSSSADVIEANRRAADAEKKLAESTVVFQERLSQLEADYQAAVQYVKTTEKMFRRMREELTKYKSQNAFLQTELHELKRQSLRDGTEGQQGWESEKERLEKEIEALHIAQKTETASAAEQIKSLQTKLDQHVEERDVLKLQLSDVQKELQTATEKTRSLEEELQRMKGDTTKSNLEAELTMAKANTKRLEQENQSLETRALEAEEKISLLLDQFENSVDSYRRSIVGVTKRDGNSSPPISPRTSSVGNRTSIALDSLAHELDQLRSHWESSTARYRLSTASSLGRDSPTHTGLGLMPTFDFDSHRPDTGDSNSSQKVNGVRRDGDAPSRWREGPDSQPARLRQITA